MSDEEKKPPVLDFADIPRPMCSSCPYFDGGKQPPDAGLPGKCRKGAPRHGGEDGYGRWWRVERSDWCGDHPVFQVLLQQVQSKALMSPLTDAVHGILDRLPGVTGE